MAYERPKVSEIKPEFMFHELSRMLLAEADQIALTMGVSVADEFIGIDLGEEVAFSHLLASQVDLNRFAISGIFCDALAFISHPCPNHAMGIEVYRLRSFVRRVSRADPLSSVSHRRSFMTADGICRIVADAAIARHKLEVTLAGDFTTRELALLSEIIDTAVRESIVRGDATRRDKNRYLKTHKLEHSEAEHWLSKQPGFRSSWSSPKDDPHVRKKLTDVRSREELGTFISQHCMRFSALTTKTMSGVPSVELETWKSGKFGYDANKAVDLARRMGVDVSLFVGKVLEVCLRSQEERLISLPKKSA